MKKVISLLFIILMIASCFAIPPKNNKKKKNKQKNSIELEEIVIQAKNPLTSYKASNTIKFNLIHTKLEVEPILNNKTLEGFATLTLKPHFYEQNELVLDAKYMKLHHVAVKKNSILIPLSYTYDSLQIKIILDKTYTRNDTFKIVIDYTAQPYNISNEVLAEYGRGMYFINPLQKNPYKPVHIWTQGEEEASSIWFPTIEATNQKTTQEVLVKLDTAFLSLSNGILVETTLNNDGTKIDYWKQDIAHAPYLFFLGIGDYIKVVDEGLNNKPIDYYTFKQFENTAKPVFGNTKAMVEYYSNLLGVPFPWDKYSQILAYDYTAGAMENSSAVIFYDNLLITPEQIRDKNFDWIIAHELFHQWFGDLVTAESWANLTLNESFADYGEYLWAEHYFGKDYADGYNMESFEKYITSATRKNEALFFAYYDSPHDNFDAIRYEKGGRVLHMLRNYIGDEAFFLSLKKYLQDHQFGSAEINDFRQSVEAITGEDLNWFFNQWYYEKGHPIIHVKNSFDAAQQTIAVTVKQTQRNNFAPIFKLPTTIAVHVDGKVLTKEVVIIDKEMTFYFPAKSEADWVNFDTSGTLLAEVYENNTVNQNIYKYNNGSLFIDKYEALYSLANDAKNNTAVMQCFYNALFSTNEFLQEYALFLIRNMGVEKNDTQLVRTINFLALSDDESPKIRVEALKTLDVIAPNKLETAATTMINKDKSLMCQMEALEYLSMYNYSKAFQLSSKYANRDEPIVLNVLCRIYKDTSVNHLETFKKAIWLNNYATANNNFIYFEEYLIKQDKAQIQEALLFLKDINQYEESDFNTYGAVESINYLGNYFAKKLKEKKLSEQEKNKAEQILKDIEVIEKDLIKPEKKFSFH